MPDNGARPAADLFDETVLPGLEVESVTGLSTQVVVRGDQFDPVFRDALYADGEHAALGWVDIEVKTRLLVLVPELDDLLS